MRSRVVKALRSLDAVPIENPILPGTPDIEYIGGWIELKSAKQWPARPTTPLRVTRFTVEQRLFLRRRVERGGNAWLLLRVGTRDWLLFRGDKAAQLLDYATKSVLMEAADRVWDHAPTEEDLLSALVREGG